jgi:hypothetical protein
MNMRKTLGIVLCAAMAFSLGSVNVHAASSTVTGKETLDVQSDVAKMYRVKHELKIALSGKNATLDGKKLDVDKPILREGRIYVPIRTLKQSGAADLVEWDSVKREVRVVMKSTILPSWSELRYRIGSNKLYTAEGTALGDEIIPAPFISGGRAYVPIRPLTYQGVAVSFENKVVSWSWSEKLLDLNQSKWTVDKEQTTFTMLYQKDMYPPYYMFSYGGGGWGGVPGQVIEEDIALDGRLFNRIKFTVKLRPGVNPIELSAISSARQHVEITRTVADPSAVSIALTEEATGNTEITAPSQGYVKLKVGESLTVAGNILKDNPQFDQVTLSAYQYDSTIYDFKAAGDPVIALIKDNKYSGTLKFDSPGTYWVSLLSPRYIPFIETGPLSTAWASLTVEVE